MWLKSDRGEIEVYLCPEDDGSASPRSASSMDEGKGESVSAGSTFDSKSALEAATRSPDKDRSHYKKNSRCSGSALRPEESEAMKYAFISEDDDLGTIGSTKSYLMISEGDVVPAAEPATTAVKQEAGNSAGTSSHTHLTPAANVQHSSTYLSASCSVAGPQIIMSSGTANSSPRGSLPFLSLEPPLSEEDYNFALEASEGITDLFDEDLLLTSS